MTISTSTIGIAKAPTRAIQLFQPPADAVYTIEATAHLIDMPRRMILVYCKHQLVSPIRDRDSGYYFDRKGIRALRRIAALRPICGDDLAGIKIILDLTNQLERLHSEMRALTQPSFEEKKRSPINGGNDHA
jgi:DNA-binding transcriptional MerR regulator